MQFFKVQATKAFCLSRQCFNAGMDLKFFQTVTTIYSRFFCSVNRDLLPFSYHSTLSIVKLCQRSMQFDFLVTVIVAQSFFCSTCVPLACTRWVCLTFSGLCTHSKQRRQKIPVTWKFKKLSGMWGNEPGAVG